MPRKTVGWYTRFRTYGYRYKVDSVKIECADVARSRNIRLSGIIESYETYLGKI